MPREQVRRESSGKGRVGDSPSRLLLPNPRNLPPTRHHPPPAPVPIAGHALPRSSRGGFVGYGMRQRTCFRCAASSRRRAALAVYRRRRTRGISVGVARHFRTRPGARRADTARPACRRRERSDFRLGRDDRLGRGRRNSPTPLSSRQNTLSSALASQNPRAAFRAENSSRPLPAYPSPFSPVRASDPQQPSASPPPRARPNRVPRTHERSR